MSRWIAAFAFALLALGFPSARAGDEPDVRVAGPLSTKPLLMGVVRALKHDKNLDVGISTDYSSMDAVDAVAQEKVGVALVTKPLTLEIRAQYPGVNLETIPVGVEAVALGISSDIWDSGLHTISRESMRGIYEQKITNWKDIGGPDEKITLFSFEQGHGTWEIFAEWMYGDNRKAPLPKVQVLNSSQDARDSLEFTPGAIVPLDASFVDGSRCHALGIDMPDKVARPVPEDIASKVYPIARPIIAVTVGHPSLAIRAVTDFLTSPDGQALVKKCGDLGAEAVPTPTPNPYY